ncbi:MAG: DUF1385 domain-containing protein [Peptococcia bacterium]
MAKCSYGGQAVIEGVMMRGRKTMAVAVRKNSGEIVVTEEKLHPLGEKIPFLKWPLIRGTVALIDSLVIGIRVLTYSANQAVEEEDSEESISPVEMVVSVVLALALGVGIFFLIPVGLAALLENYVPNHNVQNLLEGLFRIALFLIYVAAISRMKDIQRVFQYHGAEHKTIFSYENGEELTVENVRKNSTLHPRCGTNFMLVVMVISILVFSLLGKTDLLTRFISRIVLLPVVSGLSYEYIKFAGKYTNNSFVRVIIKPGLWLQKFTTREPDDSMLEVAIQSLLAVIKAEEGDDYIYSNTYDKDIVTNKPSLEV